MRNHEKPVVAVTPSTENNGKYHVSVPYFDVLERAGVIPVLLPMHLDDNDVEQVVNIFDGFLFAGGCDVLPSEYGEETVEACGEIQPQRDKLELALFRRLFVLKPAKPVLAICRGLQVMNVAAGGSLYQDIAAQYAPDDGKTVLTHRQEQPSYIPTHHVTVAKDTLLYGIIGGLSDLYVNSHHHQAVKKPGAGMKISAVSSDGIIEAMEYEGLPFCIGVQWHPEHLAAGMPEQMKIFEAFATACSK
ncbi:MAG: gamma-glutamyl-gamma-aminobutyrate hydrolase family protein [Clostridia bacterium]|nr:gamma-glutamyl-gamma-aminobutyrate hydrolase family protein [Clostridia bacterium]